MTLDQVILRFCYRLVRTENGCLEYQGARTRNGYGRIKARGLRSSHIDTHRLAWELAYGPIPPGQHVLHRCDNPPCCEPTHLFLGDQAANSADMVAKGRQRGGHAQAQRTECPRGHKYSPENTYRHQGRRHCRQCQREADATWRARRARSTTTTQGKTTT